MLSKQKVGGVNLDNKKYIAGDLFKFYMELNGGFVEVGKTVTISPKPDTSLNKEEYQTLIDLALATNDKEWFMELTEKMQSVAI